MIEHFDLIYCLGWDPASHAVVGVLSADTARDREILGKPYSVLMLVGGAPTMLLDVAWRDHVCLMWRFDRERRRTARYDFRRLDGDQVLLVEHVEWRYTDSHQPEFDTAAGRTTTRYRPDGMMRESVEPYGDRGGRTDRAGRIPIDSLPWLGAPSFGEWATLASLDGEVSETSSFAAVESVPYGLSVSTADVVPWRPPVPREAGDLEKLLRAGTQRTLPDGTLAAVEIHDMGQLRMPSGQLVVADPGWFDETLRPYSASVVPGTYSAKLSVARPVADPHMAMPLAAWLVIKDEPVSMWELALRPGEDPRVLGDGEFFGVGVDTGTACFVDGAAVSVIADLNGQDQDVLDQVHGAATVSLEERSARGNLIAFKAGMGDGVYPTWIGRTAIGEIAAFVVDFLVSDDTSVPV